MNVFTPNTFQIANRRLSEKMLISVIDAIRQDGYAIIENIVNCEDLSQISEQMDKDSAILMKENVGEEQEEFLDTYNKAPSSPTLCC